MSDLYYQCKLERYKVHDSAEVTVGWIEARGAKIGARVELLDLSNPKDLWTVVEVGAHPLDKKTLQAKQAADRKSLPSIGRQR